ncbi:Hypothetical predicted protein [Lecanosticta acicola]|uniref:Uncharacterized protein n=1 Tax=Lecanosticta acicola TaxID=111012 RepID=A0AAI8Z2G6_9PEZI|nr:Hypothetical predicted protein [Lecanosticta acicola]
MALHRGIQSAIFYYLACTPCAEIRYKKRRKQEAKQSRRERQLLEEENPNHYRHPSPSSTNPHWQVDIALGPTLTVRGKRRTNGGDGSRGRKASRYTNNDSAEPSSVDLAGQNSVDGRNDSNWNTRPYQREDEELWGSTTNFAGSIYGDSLRRPPKAYTKGSHQFRNPEVNAMHPATVTTVSSREEAMWMMQPPPVAEVMSGKKRAPRSRSDSGASRLNSSSVPSSRQLSSRLTQHRAPSTPMSRECSSQASNGSTGQRHDRSATTSERDFAISPIQTEPRVRRKPPPIQIVHDDSKESLVTAVRLPSIAPSEAAGNPQQATRTAPRPQLSTIASDNSVPDGLRPGSRTPPRSSKENSHPGSADDFLRDKDGSLPPRAAVVSSGAPIKFELAPRSINGKVIRTTTAPDVREGVGIRYGGHHKYHDSEDDFLSIRPELIDSWYTPDFELPKWVHEHTKREVKQRWSMDL